MQLDILTPERKVYSGEATSVKLPGIENNNFELLDDHAPMITALGEGIITYVNAEGTVNIKIKDGFVECLQNRVVVLVSGAE